MMTFGMFGWDVAHDVAWTPPHFAHRCIYRLDPFVKRARERKTLIPDSLYKFSRKQSSFLKSEICYMCECMCSWHDQIVHAVQAASDASVDCPAGSFLLVRGLACALIRDSAGTQIRVELCTCTSIRPI